MVGGYVNNLNGVRNVIFNLPEVQEAIARAQPVYIGEGEKDCITLGGLNIVATCNHGGAGKWKAKHSEFLMGADVVILPDNDKAGWKHAKAVATSLAGVAVRIRIVELPGLAQKGDVSDWVAAGGTREELDRLVKATSPLGGPPRARDYCSPLDPAPSGTLDENAPTLSDCDLSDLMAERHAGTLRYVAAWGKWFHYSDGVWKPESTHLARSLAKSLCQEVAATRSESEGRRIASAKTVAGIQTLSASDRRIAATVEQWDADPMLLNTPGGVVDLHTGLMRPHRPDDHMSKITAVAPGGECPQWLVFLKRIFDGDDELIAYCQRVVGYSLTGSTCEHAMLFGYGLGGNGKSAVLDTTAGILNDYHTTSPIEPSQETGTRPSSQCCTVRD